MGAASQPGLTIVDPLVASALGVILFGERLNHAPAAFTGEILAVALLVISVLVLSRSPLVHDEHQDENAPAVPVELGSAAQVTRDPRRSPVALEHLRTRYSPTDPSAPSGREPVRAWGERRRPTGAPVDRSRPDRAT